jgi:hypothetical protein
MAEEERRTAPRHAAYIGAEIKDQGGPISAAITHDGSASGLLLLTRAKLEVGQSVELMVFLVEGEGHTVVGKVVRQEPLDAEENTLWRTKVAVHIETPDPELGKHFEELAKEQERVYGGKLKT